MQISRKDCLGEADVLLPDGRTARYYLFTAPYNSQDCYYFVPTSAMDGLPTSRLGIQKLADLGVYCDHWDVPVKTAYGSDFRAAVLRAFSGIMAVEDVHAL